MSNDFRRSLDHISGRCRFASRIGPIAHSLT